MDTTEFPVGRLRASRAFVLAVALLLTGAVPQPQASAADEEDLRVLVFSRTVGFRHASIADGIALVESLGSANDFVVDATEDPSAFEETNLATYDAVIWLSTTGDVLDASQQSAFESYIQSGGAYVGIHAAADCEYGWPWYGQLLGGDAWFLSHPSIQDAFLDVEPAEAGHPSTAHYPSRFEIREEWYNFQNNPRPSVRVLLTLDESTYNAGSGAMGDDHPIAWYHEFDGGRSWYTAMGHRSETFQDSDFASHLLGGILWAAGRLDAPSAVPLCGTGAVNAGCGAAEDVLLLNGSAGAPSREITLATTDPLVLTIREPASGSGDGNDRDCVVYVWVGRPDPSDVVELPRQLGPMCFGPASLATRAPALVWNAIGYPAKLGEDDAPGPAPRIEDGTPFELFARPSGLDRCLTVTFQGLIEDECSVGSVPFSVTNGLVLRVR